MNIIININLTSFRRSGPQLGVQDNFIVAPLDLNIVKIANNFLCHSEGLKIP